MIKRMIIVGGSLTLVFGAIFTWKSYQADQMAIMRASVGAPAAVVSSTQAIAEQWQDKINAVGGLNAIQGVEVSSEVPGKITKINFTSGHQVETGALLVQL
ncbi:MAG: efflux transporter periplasmic adaptor subunit, partial [Proteobacteria bacterium]|nr:efflux transporter periplasmic adaptor subunit [Pseudomonadota bacterium]